MAIVEADLEFRMSGGASNTDVNAALGGAMSTVGGGVITTNVLNNDMDDITGTEASAGITIYHAYYYKNNHGSLSWLSPVFWIDSQTTSATTDVAVALSDEAKNTTMETIGSETTAPSGPSFTTPANKAAGLALTTLAFSEYRGIWARYVVTAGTTAVLDSYTIKAEGDTNP